MYSGGELFIRSPEGHFAGHFPGCAATREINIKITLEWAHKQFITRVTLAIIGTGNGLSPICRQVITCTNADLLSISPPLIKFCEISIKKQVFVQVKHLEMSLSIWQLFYSGLNFQLWSDHGPAIRPENYALLHYWLSVRNCWNRGGGGGGGLAVLYRINVLNS